MKDYQREFIEFAIERGVLRFGEFTLKSGRLSPYYFNFGLFNTGSALARLGHYFAQALVDSGIKCDVIRACIQRHTACYHNGGCTK